jgi:predicted acylesterase/phospholipase RssA
MQKNILKATMLGLLSASALGAMEYENTALTTGLALEGRGMQALIPAVVLREMEHETQLPVHELFDVAGGTSAGTLIMAKAFSPRAPSMSQLVDNFKEFGPQAFKPKPSTWMKDLGNEYIKYLGVPVGAVGGIGLSTNETYKGYRSWGEKKQAAHDRISREVTDIMTNNRPTLGDAKEHVTRCFDVSEETEEYIQERAEFFYKKTLENAFEQHEQVTKARQKCYDQEHNDVKGIGKEIGKSLLWSWAGHTAQFLCIKGFYAIQEPFLDWYSPGREKIIPPPIAQYETQSLGIALHNLFDSKRLKDSLKQILVPVSKKDGTVYLFDSAKALRKHTHNYSLANVVQASMSHPEDFNSQMIFSIKNTSSGNFYDGGLMRNNPTTAVYRQLKKIQPAKSNIFLLSLGMGEIEDKPDFPLSKWGLYTFPTRVEGQGFPGTNGRSHDDITSKLGRNYVRKQAEFSYPAIYREPTQDMLEEYEQKGISLARELEEADVFRKLAENRSNKRQTQLVDDEVNAFEELTGITLRKSPAPEKEQEGSQKEEASGGGKELEADLKKKN